MAERKIYMSEENKNSKIKAKSIFWGVLLLLGAAAIIVSKLGYLEGMGIGSILLSVCLIGLLIKGLIGRSFTLILFPIAFLIIVNDEILHLESITPWPVLGAALLGSIGLNMLFPKFKKNHFRVFVNTNEVPDGHKIPVSEEKWEGNSVAFENVFGGAVKYLSGDVSRVAAENVFGTLQIYFTDACLTGGSATIMVENVFSTMVIYVPSSWKVAVNTSHVFGSTSEHGYHDPDGNTVLYVKGEVCFGSLKIKYV